MTLQQYTNQSVVQRQMHYSVMLEPDEYSYYYIDPKTVGIHIFKYPDFSYVVTEKSGYVMATRDEPHRIVYKPTVFRINTNHLTKFNFNLL